MFKRTPDLHEWAFAQVGIFVGGGNTRSLLGVWREWGLHEVLRDSWHAGIVLSGVSAGAICWFEEGSTDSWVDRLRRLDCLGFLPGSCCPHYDAAAHYVGTKLCRVVTARSAAGGYSLRLAGGEVREARLQALDLSAADGGSGHSLRFRIPTAGARRARSVRG